MSFDVFKRGRAARPVPRELSKLAALRIVGDTPVPPDELMKAAGLKVGRGESALRFEQAADRVRARLVADGWFGATVDTESAPAAGDPRSVELTLRIVAGPRIRVSWTGDDPGKKVRSKAVAAWPAYASPESAAAIVARAARVLLQADRYYLAKVDHEVRPGEGESDLTLRVEKGPRGRDVALDFEGNTVLDDDALRKVLPKPGSREFFEGLAGRGNRLSTALRVAYARVGYLRTRALRPRSGFDPTTGRLHVVVPVRERGASRVSALLLPQELKDAGAKSLPLRLREGRPFDLDAYIADRDAIAAWYRNAGWMEARVRGVLEPAGEDLRVRLEVAPGPRLRAGEIRIESHGRSKPGMIRHAVVVEPGALIRPQELSESRARLSELGVFRSVDVRPVPLQEIGRVRKAAPATGGRGAAREGGSATLPDGARADAPPAAGSSASGGSPGEKDRREGVSDIVVSYVERPDVTLEYGLRYSSSGSVGVGGAPTSPDNGRLQVAGALDLANPLGWGWHLRPYALLTTDRHTFGAALESATLLGLRVRTQLLVFDDDDNRATVSSLASRIRGFSLQQTRALLEDTSAERRHDRLRLQWGYADKRIQYFDGTGAETSLAGKRSYLSLSLAGDERDSLADPHRGLFWTASSELARTAFGSDVDYLRLYGQLFVYLPLPGRMVWAQGYRAGVAPGRNPLLLLDNRFQAGGPTTVRGYDQNDLGPQTTEGIGLGGQGVVILNQELRFPIWNLVSGGVFWDAGNVWETANEIRLGDLRQSVGVGLRVMFPFGPVRLEYAWKVGPQPERPGGSLRVRPRSRVLRPSSDSTSHPVAGAWGCPPRGLRGLSDPEPGSPARGLLARDPRGRGSAGGHAQPSVGRGGSRAMAAHLAIATRVRCSDCCQLAWANGSRPIRSSPSSSPPDRRRGYTTRSTGCLRRRSQTHRASRFPSGHCRARATVSRPGPHPRGSPTWRPPRRRNRPPDWSRCWRRGRCRADWSSPVERLPRPVRCRTSI